VSQESNLSSKTWKFEELWGTNTLRPITNWTYCHQPVIYETVDFTHRLWS